MTHAQRRRPRVGLSANILHRDTERELYGGRSLLYLEQSMGTWLMRAGGRPYLIPFAPEETEVETGIEEMLAGMDGLVLQGGADMAPESYGESPIEEQWSGDAVRDRYELALLEVALERGVPVLGICRGVQLINVARGGTLYQDVATQFDGARVHRDREVYDGLTHAVEFEAGSYLAELYDGTGGDVVSVHHQGLRELGEGLRIEARSADDGLVEAVRLEEREPWVVGVQWHPEFQAPEDASLLDPMTLVEAFLDRCRAPRN